VVVVYSLWDGVVVSAERGDFPGWIKRSDFPGWIMDRLVAEGLVPLAWRHAARLERGFGKLGVDLVALGSEEEPLGVTAVWKADGRHIADEHLRPGEARPVFEALNRLAKVIGDAKPWVGLTRGVGGIDGRSCCYCSR
jgi:hypothetical protein